MAKILVIDDDASVRTVVSRILERAGYETETAANGLEGIEAMRRTRFALVICDMLMPVQEGIETIQEIRSAGANIPIIAISGAFGDEGYSPLDDARAIGADVAVAKPFTVEELLAAVDEAFERGHA